MLLLTDREVDHLVSMHESIKAVEQGFLALGQGRAQMPPKVYLDFPEHQGDLRVMPAALAADFAGVKLVNSHPGNPARGLPTVMATYLLFSQETGTPLCLMGASALTGKRTGAGAAVATKFLARNDSRTLGLIGAGVQARYQAEAIYEVLEFSQSTVWAPERDHIRRDAFLHRMKAEFPAVEWTAAVSIEEAAGADIVCTTTPSRSFIVPASSVRPGAHINAVGADAHGKQELDPDILKKAVLVVDDLHQALGGGEINVPISQGKISEKHIAGSLADLVSGKLEGRTSDDQITVFDSTGIAIQDIALASVAYHKAQAEGIGFEWDS